MSEEHQIPASNGPGSFDSAAWYRLIKAAFLSNRRPLEWPPAGSQQDEWRHLVEDVLSIQNYTRKLASGDLSPELKVKGYLAGSLKELQANLRHLGWQVQRIAGGDWNQKVEFMGDFSADFNRMTESLSQTKAELLASEARYRLLAENAGDVIWTLDLQGRFTYISPSVKKLRGYSVEEAMSQTLQEALTPDSAQIVWTKLAEIARQDFTDLFPPHESFELQQPCKDGSLIWVEVTTTGLFDENRRLVGIQGASRDITERRRAQQAEGDQRALAEALRDTASALNKALTYEEVYDALLVNVEKIVPHSSVDILMVEPDGAARIVRTGGYEFLAEGSPSELAQIRLNVAETENLKQMTATRRPLRVDEIMEFPWVETGVSRWARSSLGAPICVKDQVIGFIVLLSLQPNSFSEQQANQLMAFTDQAAIAIEKARLFAQLNEMATIDDLTRILNRRAFLEKGEYEFERSVRYRRPFSALMLDIDHFKQINDSCGHSAGDQVLRKVARICAQSIRKVDVLGRYGGEEFAIVMPEIHAEEAWEAAERIRLSIAETLFETPCEPVSVTISIGVSEYAPSIATFRSLLDKADEALYQAKMGGRNQVKRYK